MNALAAARALRPRHWAKNVFVFAPLVFAQRLGEGPAVLRTLAAFGVFCALSSAVYLINDLADRGQDRLHPVKRHRPIASGELAPGPAAALAGLLGIGGLLASAALGAPVAAVSAAYLFLNLAYSLGLKQVVILDVMIVAAGFLLRAGAGALAVGVAISHWLILCTGLLALFLGFVKRRQELEAAYGSGQPTRPILQEYTPAFLDQMIGVVTASTVVCYSLYAFSPEVADKLGTRHLGFTLPFVLFGIFRYLYLVHRRGQGENPTRLVFTDPPLVVNVALWGATVLLVLYWWR